MEARSLGCFVLAYSVLLGNDTCASATSFLVSVLSGSGATAGWMCGLTWTTRPPRRQEDLERLAAGRNLAGFKCYLVEILLTHYKMIK